VAPKVATGFQKKSRKRSERKESDYSIKVEDGIYREGYAVRDGVMKEVMDLKPAESNGRE
jgi:hypothetical protein